MSDYQAQFDSFVTEANSAVANHTVELGDALPGLHPSHLRRLFASISRLLGIVDRKEAAHPEYLADSPRNVPEHAVELVSSIPSSFTSGVPHFVQNVLPSLVDAEQRLMEAVGSAAFAAQKIRNQHVKAIERLHANAGTVYSNTYAAMQNAQKDAKSVADVLANINQTLATATTDAQKVAETRLAAEKLARGNASQNPLEALVRSARERSEEIDQIRDRASKSEKTAATAAARATESETASHQALESLKRSDERADDILRNATQAGLAGAYKTERDKLSKEQNRFAGAFYGIILLIILYAAIFLLPIFKGMVGLNGEHVSVEDSALMLLVRLAIISPVIWALIFTNRRFRYLETLQMDYAAKASTALAYSGYIDEMEEDPQLSRRLKDGLVLRFLEHPSRLLGKKQETDVSTVGPDGVRLQSTTATPDATSSALEQ